MRGWMKIIELLLMILAGCSVAWAESPEQKIAPLLKVYGQHFQGVEGNMLIWKDGTRMVIDDGQSKDFAALLSNPDLKDQFLMVYPHGESTAPAGNADPGRIRNLAFFKKMYGSTPVEVKAELVEVPWISGGRTRSVLMTRVNGVNEQMAKVVADLNGLPEGLKKYVSYVDGTFTWRNIAGTEGLSTHSFGITMDIDVKNSDYWRWAKEKGADPIPYKNRIPYEIVRIFEKHGFIWGGKWYHYDTMHFEYRPELLIQ